MTYARVLGCFALVLLLSACTNVAPWERGRLAKPHMALEPQPSLRALRSHVYMSREAAPPAAGESQGAGCGCY